ncbi:hypothetical protein [Nocardioides sp. SYSU D00038]|uniref:hypothetical protein n=1 Tax=Nocardioides sp. SYSU D00038 TaxID=2812554 RepID=UPI00196891B5|nr:hypothetical protein [Nocardioides sp. SYSU D00038]
MRTTHRIATGIAATCLVAGSVAVVATGGASALVAEDGPAPQPRLAAAEAPADAPADEAPEGIASASAPYIPGVWHVPADVLLTVGPGESRYVGPQGSLFNGPVDAVNRRVDAWWAEQLAAGLTPEEADRKLARLGR